MAWLARLAHWGAGAILADEMGLGKTVQTLALLAHRAAQGPALVVAPTSVVPNWVDEAARFVPELKVRLYRGKERAAGLRGLGPGDVVVTSYAIATLDAEALAPHRLRVAGDRRGPGGQERHHRAGQGAARAARRLARWGSRARPSRTTWASCGASCA